MNLEQIILALDILLRRWWLFLLPLVMAIPLATLVIYKMPTKYVANSIILLESANRGDGWGGGASGLPRQNAIEQVHVIEAWLKSDHVLAALLPKLKTEFRPKGPTELFVEMAKLRAALNLELVGNSVLKISLEGPHKKGLGRKLEIIVTHLLEGLMRPDAGILNASQLVLMRRAEAIKDAQLTLKHAINEAGLKPASFISSQLQKLYDIDQKRLTQALNQTRQRSKAIAPRLKHRPSLLKGTKTGSKTKENKEDLALLADDLRRSISRDPHITRRLERLYARIGEEQIAYEALKQNMQSSGTNYVMIFDAPEKLRIIGRPRDPLVGQNPGRKLAIAEILLSILSGAGLVLLAEFFDNRLRARQEFETLSGLPIVARMSKLDSAENESS